MKKLRKLLNISLLLFPILSVSCGAEDMWERLQESGYGYHVIYHPNGGTAGSVPEDDNLYAPDASATVKGNTGNLARLGYIFAEWNTASDGSGTPYTASDILTLNGADIILYAVWYQIPTNDVTYNANGGTPATSIPVDTTFYQYHQIVTVQAKPTDLTRAGFFFIGWNTASNGSGTNYTQGQTFSMGLDPVTLYANWTNLSVYTVTYSNLMADGGTAPLDTTNYLNGAKVTVLGNTGNLYRTGYYFTGWTDGITDYFTGDQLTISGSNVTLDPRWVLTSTPTYTVTYNANLADSGTIPIDNTHYQLNDDPPVLPNSGNLVRAGYSFVCWNTKSNGTGIDYEPGSISGSGIIDINANIVLYAKWSFPVMADENFDDGNFDTSQFVGSGVSISGGILSISNGCGIKSRLFKIPAIIEGMANIRDSSASGFFERFCIRQDNYTTYNSSAIYILFGFASGFDYANIMTDTAYWDTETTNAHDVQSTTPTYTENAYHVFRMEIYNNIQYFFIDDTLVRTENYSFLSNTWWNFIMIGDSNTAALQLDWIKIYTSRPSDVDPVWP